MGINRAKEILEKQSKDIAFFIGNGINLHYNKGVSWNDLLLKVWREFVDGSPPKIPKGISPTEFYDVLEIQNFQEKGDTFAIQNKISEIMGEWKFNKKQNNLLNHIKQLDSPILTTNFDDLIPTSLGLEFKKMVKTGFTDFYPWSCYYGNKDGYLDYPTGGFGVWYPNGMIKYPRSIRFGLSHYMQSVAKARKLIHEDPENISFEGKNQNPWPGYKTWLHIVFNKPLFIFGLGLNESEVFIRWLLIERAKYYKKFPDRTHKGWYLIKKNENKKEIEGKKFFLKSVGIDVIELDTYEEIYEEIWK